MVYMDDEADGLERGQPGEKAQFECLVRDDYVVVVDWQVAPQAAIDVNKGIEAINSENIGVGIESGLLAVGVIENIDVCGIAGDVFPEDEDAAEGFPGENENPAGRR